MSLYKKKLSSMEALRREQLRLKWERSHTSKDDLLPVREMKGKKNKNASEGIMGLVSGLAGSKSSMQTVSLLAGPLLKMINKKTGKNVLITGATELIGGYIKWKLIQMSYRGIKLFIKARKEKARRKAAFQMH